MIELRPAQERGHTDFGWLDSRHTFSFGRYFDPRHQGFRALVAINDDRVAPGGGFPTHPHRDMEILSYVLEGTLAHKDSMGHEELIRAGEVQKMSAGRGVTHSEYNGSKREPVHFLQIWIEPSRRGIAPAYAQVRVPEGGGAVLLAGPAGSGAPIVLEQDARLVRVVLRSGESATLPVAAGRGAWVHVVRGRVRLGEATLGEGDGAAVEGEPVSLRAEADAEALFFDLA